MPNWKVQPPSWVTNKFLSELAIKDYGDEAFYFPRNKYEEFNGSNFAFKKDLFKKYGQFNIYLNRAQDTEIFRKFLSRGSRLLYYPKRIVFHTIDKDRLNKNHFKKMVILILILRLRQRVTMMIWLGLDLDLYKKKSMD